MKNNGKFKEHAFVLEEMAKKLIDGTPKLLLKPQEQDHMQGISCAPSQIADKNRKIHINQVDSIDKVV